jgi:hypothetical protein
MLNKKRANYFFRKAIPFLLILISSIIPFTIYFRDGIPQGDDMIWHLTYMYDLYYGFKNGFSGVSTSHLLSSYYGEDIYLFYGPFAHYLTVILTLMFEWAGATIITSMKFVTIASVFISGIFVFLLAKKITKSTQISTLFGIAFCFFPYRLVDFLYRAAYCEGVAIGLIPVVFYGLYRVLHDEKPRVSAYVCLVIGVSCLVLCHPITALLTAVAAVIYTLANTLNLIRALHKWQNVIYISVSVLLIFGFVSFYFFPMFMASVSGYYRLTDSGLMGTTAAALTKAQEANWGYCGVLNFDWLKKVTVDWGWAKTNDSELAWTISLSFFVVSCLGAIIADGLLRKTRKLNTWREEICLGITFGPSIALGAWERPEIFCALGVFYLAYLYVNFDFSDPNDRLPARFEVKKTFSNPDVYVAIGIIVACFLLLFTDWAWYKVPSILCEIQFPFRLYAILGFMAYFLAMPFTSWMRGNRKALLSLAFVASLLCVLDQSPVDKRIAIANNGNTIYTSADANLVASVKSIGWENEYVPNVFYDDSYQSDYSNSLYSKIRTQFIYNLGFPSKSDYLNPAYLEGTGTISLTSLNTPDVVFGAQVTSDEALVQIPQFYYDGYEITLVSDSGAVTTEEGQYVDGLVAFKMAKGAYTVKVNFVGSKAYQIGRVAFFVSIPALIGLGCFGVYLRKKEEKTQVLTGLSR